MTTFCAEQEISRKTFYALRARARAEGQAAVLEPRSRRPRTSPTRLSEATADQAVAVRASLELSGLDHGPVSVHDKMVSMGLEAPSVASLARIFRARDVARAEPRKRPRAAWRRFVYPAPNACWQLDSTEYVLERGRKCVIFQLQDDHSRLAVASLVARAETSDAAVRVFDKGVRAYGVPQRLLTDNGASLNPTRRGRQGRLVDHVRALGVEPITGKPYKPTTQGKNERFHSTLLRWLDKQPLAATVAELQAQVDTFDRIYNTERPHQSLPGRATPAQAWDATEVAQAPRPPHDDPPAQPARPPRTPRPRGRDRIAPTGTKRTTIGRNGTISLAGTAYLVSRSRAGQEALITWDAHRITITDPHGEVLTQYPWPQPGTRYVSHHDPATRATRGGRPRKTPRNVTDVLTHQPSPMS